MKNKKKYQILMDYGENEGIKLFGDGYDSLDEAVKEAHEESYGYKFYIVKIVKWKAKPIY